MAEMNLAIMRLDAEHVALVERIHILRSFFETDEFKNLSVEEKTLMQNQEHHMTFYATALDKRIDLAKSKL